MKPIGKSVCVIIAVVCTVIFFTGFFGVSTRYGDITTDVINGAHLVPRGFGFENSVFLSMVADSETDAEAEIDYAAAKRVLERRLGYSAAVEFEVFPDTENNGFFVVFPHDSNMAQNIALLGRILVTEGRLEIREGNESDDSGAPSGVTENVIISNEHISAVRPMLYSNSTQGAIYYLEFDMTPQGRKILNAKAKEMTEAAADGETPYISVWIDGVMSDYYTASEVAEAEKLTAFSNSSAGYTLDDVSAISVAVMGGRLEPSLRVFKISAEHTSGFAGDSTFAFMSSAFALMILLSGAVLFWRYRAAAISGFISLIGSLGFMFLVLTGFYGTSLNLNITYATFGAFMLIFLFGVLTVIRDAESVKVSASGAAPLGKILSDAYGRTRVSSAAAYAALAVAGIILSDLFKRNGGLSSWLVRLVFPSFSPNRFLILGHFGTIIWVGALFGLIMMIFVNQLTLKSLMSFAFFGKSAFFKRSGE